MESGNTQAFKIKTAAAVATAAVVTIGYGLYKYGKQDKDAKGKAQSNRSVDIQKELEPHSSTSHSLSKGSVFKFGNYCLAHEQSTQVKIADGMSGIHPSASGRFMEKNTTSSDAREKYASEETTEKPWRPIPFSEDSPCNNAKKTSLSRGRTKMQSGGGLSSSDSNLSSVQDTFLPGEKESQNRSTRRRHQSLPGRLAEIGDEFDTYGLTPKKPISHAPRGGLRPIPKARINQKPETVPPICDPSSPPSPPIYKLKPALVTSSSSPKIVKKIQWFSRRPSSDPPSPRASPVQCSDHEMYNETMERLEKAGAIDKLKLEEKCRRPKESIESLRSSRSLKKSPGSESGSLIPVTIIRHKDMNGKPNNGKSGLMSSKTKSEELDSKFSPSEVSVSPSSPALVRKTSKTTRRIKTVTKQNTDPSIELSLTEQEIVTVSSPEKEMKSSKTYHCHKS